MDEYFDKINNELKNALNIANDAKSTGYDPSESVEILIAKNMAERVVSLISVIAPQIKDTNVAERIQELEKEFGKLDWRVALKIAEEVAFEKFCKFKDKKEAMEIGIRVGIAYVTNGVVSSPLEGFTQLKVRKRRDGKEYLSLFFSGPIRSAGGTGASVSVIIGDYIRKKFGYDSYDPDDKEVKRFCTEIRDYHERVTNLQYFPSEDEIKFMVKGLQVQIDGDPSEKIEVSNYKYLARMDTNKVRNGVCLVIGEGLCQKAPKLWKQLGKWGKDFDMEQWNFLSDFLEMQKKIKAKGAVKVDVDSNAKIKPDYTFIKDLVAGRPVLTHPLRVGGFRLRYGRGRNTGLSSMAIHPCTMIVLDNYIAIGTQIKVERPSKGTALSVCDSIEGPIVKLNDGSVVFFDSIEKAEANKKNVKEILFLGDLLVTYGDFVNRAHTLVPSGYCEEWWAREVEEKLKEFETDDKIFLDLLNDLANDFTIKIDFVTSLRISIELKVPMHPRYTYHWKDINKDDFSLLLDYFREGNPDNGNFILPLINGREKRVLELTGIQHFVENPEKVIIKNEDGKAFYYFMSGVKEIKGENGLEILNNNGFLLKDKSGIFIGARMGRPEKGKLRKLKGSPNVLFPVGEEGGRLRSFQAALLKGFVKGDFPIYDDKGRITIYPVSEITNEKTKKLYFDKIKNKENELKEEGNTCYKEMSIDIKHYFNSALKHLNVKEVPKLIKGVRGTSNADHTVENLAKGILRSMYDLAVNKDGTIRFDATELIITAFKPSEIGLSLEKTKELGYLYDINGKEITDVNQVVEIKPQDVILPSCYGSSEDGCDKVLFRTSKFIDELLVKFYKKKSFYNAETSEDLIGHLIIALAPHISAGITGRIIGFSKTQAVYGHPLFHCAVRRDCFAYDTFIPIFDGNTWKNIKIGEFVEKLNPDKIVDAYGTKAKKVENFWTLGYKNGKITNVKINEFTKHQKSKILRFHLEDGRLLDVTENHKFCILNKDKFFKKKANELKEGDYLVVPSESDFEGKNIEYINLEEYFYDRSDIVVRGITSKIKLLIKNIGSIANLGRILKLHASTLPNYIFRDSYPLTFLHMLFPFFDKTDISILDDRYIAVKRDNVNIPYKIPLNDDVLYLIGLYVAEGYCRKNTSKKGFYQVSISSSEEELKEKVKNIMKKYFNLSPSEEHEDHLTFSSRIVYESFVNLLKTGSDAYGKRIPVLFFNLPKAKLASFLRGYFDGDGSVDKNELRVSCDTVSEGLLADLEFALRRFGIFVKRYKYSKKPGKAVSEFYIRKKKEIPVFTATKLLILSDYCNAFYENIGFSLRRKQNILKNNIEKIRSKGMKISKHKDFVLPKIKSIEILNEQVSYCLNVDGNIVIANGIMTGQCDGDELAIMLAMDAFLNFSKKYLPAHRGSTQDACLVLSSKIIAGEVDDMAFDVDIVDKYPLEFYKACEEWKMPWEFKIKQIKDVLGKEEEYYNHKFTHPTSDINSGVLYSAYKSIPNMEEKVIGQIKLAEKIRAVDENDVARLIIDRHFIRDLRGNLRKFGMQEIRCVDCNSKYRRVPLSGICSKCNGKLIFTVSEGSVVKYLEPSLSLAAKYELPAYLKQSLDLTKMMIESVFGKDKDRQTGLGSWFSK